MPKGVIGVLALSKQFKSFRFSIPGQEFGRFAGALSLKNCLLHMFGEDLQNAHDAMSDTIALRKIAEYGAVSQGKNCQKLSMSITYSSDVFTNLSSFRQPLFSIFLHHFLNPFFSISYLMKKTGFKNEAFQQTFGTSYFSNVKTKWTSHFS